MSPSEIITHQKHPSYQTSMQGHPQKPTFFPVALYCDGYDSTKLQRFWQEVKAQYIADIDSNFLVSHSHYRNHRHTPYDRKITLEKLQAATNRPRISNEHTKDSIGSRKQALLTMRLMKPPNRDPQLTKNMRWGNGEQQ